MKIFTPGTSTAQPQLLVTAFLGFTDAFAAVWRAMGKPVNGAYNRFRAALLRTTSTMTDLPSVQALLTRTQDKLYQSTTEEADLDSVWADARSFVEFTGPLISPAVTRPVSTSAGTGGVTPRVSIPLLGGASATSRGRVAEDPEYAEFLNSDLGKRVEARHAAMKTEVSTLRSKAHPYGGPKGGKPQKQWHGGAKGKGKGWPSPPQWFNSPPPQWQGPPSHWQGPPPPWQPPQWQGPPAPPPGGKGNGPPGGKGNGPPGQRPCLDFARGNCAYGTQCRFAH